eukprot:COSAG06_NODE_1140_length_10558_cov_34.662492_6_plen_541_part_00
MRLPALVVLVHAAHGCRTHGDCAAGKYCDANGNCFSCSFVSASNCDAIDNGVSSMGSCCTEQFLHACPANPRQCSCSEHSDCAPGWFCSDAVTPGGAWTCRPCSAAALPDRCAALGSRCCARDFLRQCPSAPQRCPCAQHADCVLGMYCAKGGMCRTCTEGVNTTHCASFDDDCCSAAFLNVHCNDPLFPAANLFVPETNPRVDPHRCQSRMRWAPCPVGHQPNADRSACEPCADGWSGPGGSLSGTCSQCEAGRAGTRGLCDSRCTENEQPTYNRLRCETCQAGRTSLDGAFCQCSEGFEPVGLQCQDLRWVRWQAAGLIAVLVIVMGCIGACVHGCIHNNVRSPLRAGVLMCERFCASAEPLAYAGVGLGTTLCMIGVAYFFYCAAASCNLSPPIPLILFGGSLGGAATCYLFSIGPRVLKVVCPPGVLGGTVLRVDDDGQPVLNSYGDPIVSAGSALTRVLYSSHAVVVPEDVIPGQQFTVRIGGVSTPGHSVNRRCCKRRNVVIDDFDDAGHMTTAPPAGDQKPTADDRSGQKFLP